MAPDRSTSITTIEKTLAPPTSTDLANKLQRLSIGKIEEPVLPKIVPIRTTSVKEISNCSASCSHDTYSKKTKFRLQYNSKKLEGKDNLLNISEPLIKKRNSTIMSLKSTNSPTSSYSRPRAKFITNGVILQGSFGSICRKLFNPRRRKSISITSSSDIDNTSLITTQDSNNDYISNLNKGCGQQANLSEMPIQNGEVDELSEYFEHFVNIKLKMSSQAESMYV